MRKENRYARNNNGSISLLWKSVSDCYRFIRWFTYNVKYQNQDVSIETSSLKSDIKIIDKNNIEITISGVGDIYNINNQIDIQDYKEINKIEKTWSKSLKKDLSKVVKKVQSKYKADIFGFGNLIYKNDPKTWEKLEKEWNSKYFPNLNVKIKTNLKISATGSLVKTIKEDKSWKK